MNSLLPRIVFTVLIAAIECRPDPVSVPAVSQLHVISVHVRDRSIFDAVYLLFRDVLQLPLVYGELSKGEETGSRHYAGFSVGNAYLEPCGPYASDPPFTPDCPARFHGLTFAPGVPIDAVTGELDRRDISHSGIRAGGEMPSFVYFSDPLLGCSTLAVSCWEIRNPDDQVGLNALRSSLLRTKGGDLGLQSIAEIRIGIADSRSFGQWSNLLNPAQATNGVWTVGDGPALRLGPAPETRIEAVVIKVASLATAKSVLSAKGLLGVATPTSVELLPTKVFGLRIILEQGPARTR